MAAKFDKDMILKHRFWIMMAVALVLSLTGIFYLGFVVSADTTKLAALLSANKTYKPGANNKSIEQSEKDAAKAKESESAIWIKAYKMQDYLYHFAPNVEKEFELYDGFFATEVKIDKPAEEVKEWPQDSDGVKSGVLMEVTPEWLKIKDKDNKILRRFHKTATINGNILFEDKKLNFPDLYPLVGRVVTIKYLVGKYFMEPLTVPEQKAFAASYDQQVLRILRIVDPYNEKGEGVVLLKDWIYKDELPKDSDAVAGGGRDGAAGIQFNPGAAGPGGAGNNTGKMPFFRYVTKPWGLGGFKPYSEEAWIAQENLWVQEEIYRIIREANDSIAIFQPKGKPAEKKGETATFMNSFFEVELKLDAKNNLHFKIKNLLPRGQKIDLLFRVRMNRNLPPELVKISGPMLKPKGVQGDFYLAEPFPEAGDSQRTGIYSVAQVLSWETAAVKRIDHISIGSVDSADMSLSQRTVDKLKPLDEKAEPVAAKDDKAGDPMKGPGAFGGQAASGNKTMLDHDLWTQRYTDVTEQSRRIPVAIALIVDQEHVDRILNAFNNSKLRFLQSQALLNYYTGSLQPPPLEDKREIGGAGEGSKFNPMFSGRNPNPMMPGNIKGGMATPNAVAAPEIETNMELVIYGVMTLYQRYPPRSAASAAKQ